MEEEVEMITWEVILDVEEAMEKVFKGFSKENKSSREGLIRAMSASKEVIHNDERYFTLQDKVLRELGTTIQTINKMLDKYPVLVWTGNQSSYKDGLAKRYKPTEKFVEVLRHFNQMVKPPVKAYFKEKGSEKASYMILSKAPVPLIEKEHDLVKACHVDTESLAAYSMLCQFEPKSYMHETLLSKIIGIAKEKDGVLMQRYNLYPSGRLYGDGSENLQNAPKEIRKAAFRGCYDIDMVNCHFRVAAHVCDNEAINEYAQSAKFIRKIIADDLEDDSSEIKHALLMLLYGAGTSLRSGSALVDTFGKKKAAEFLLHPRVVLLVEGINEVKEVLYEAGHLDQPEGQPKKTISSLMSTFFQRAESDILKVCIEHVDHELLLHDGFITREDVDILWLSGKIIEATGINIELSKEEL